MTSPKDCRSGYVAILGPPNAGKSTLVNTIVGAKVSIVTHKIQTTRGAVRGIRNIGNTQVVLVDTPGIFTPQRKLERALVRAAWSGNQDADATVLLIDGRKGMTANVRAILENLTDRKQPIFVAVNKIDKVNKNQLLPLSAELDATGIVDTIHYVSALNGQGTEEFISFLADRMPVGPWLFPDDHISDLPLRRMAAEITREKVFLRVHQEIPYELTVETEQWTELDETNAVRIDQWIYVSRKNHKAILLGKKGSTIRNIGIAARKELEEILGQTVHLFIHVKVRERWLDEPARYRDIGLEYTG